MPRASRTIPRRGSADLLSVGPDDVPGRAEVVDSLSGRISGIVIGDDVVERVASVRDLGGALVPHECAPSRLTVRAEWRRTTHSSPPTAAEGPTPGSRRRR